MMDIQIEKNSLFTVAKVTGELSGAEVEPFAEQLEDVSSGDGARLAIDLSKVGMVDSTGLSSLMNLVTRSRLAGGQVVLVSPSPFVAEVLQITKLDRWFDVCQDLKEVEQKLV